MRLGWLLLALAPMQQPATATADDEAAPAYAFLQGRYLLIGKRLNSAQTYHGTVQLTLEGDALEVVRRIGTEEVRGAAGIETTHSGVPVLRMRFREDRQPREATCLWQTDQDNYARISCYVYQPGQATDDPGLEALFIDHASL